MNIPSEAKSEHPEQLAEQKAAHQAAFEGKELVESDEGSDEQ